MFLAASSTRRLTILMEGERPMSQCETCGNDYDKAFVIRYGEEEHTFDSFECAIQALAPTCEKCETRIVGHGIEANGRMYCCAHCARGEGLEEAVDRVS
jgi:hypothetical protein